MASKSALHIANANYEVAVVSNACLITTIVLSLSNSVDK